MDVDDPRVLAARRAEAERLGVDVDEVQVVVLEDVTWPDASLGCPRPGMAYAQVLVPGHRLVLRTGGVSSAHHAGAAGPFTHCPRPTPHLPCVDGRT